MALLGEFLLTKSLLDSIDGNNTFVPGDGNQALGSHLGVDDYREGLGQRRIKCDIGYVNLVLTTHLLAVL